MDGALLGDHKECDTPGRGARQGLELGMSSWRCDKRGEVTQGEYATRVGGGIFSLQPVVKQK